MAKRKLGASVIILCIAALTLVSGTYAWFLSGGAANLFDIGFDIIESSGSILLQGEKGTYDDGKTDNGGWGTKLGRADFDALSFIAEGGSFKPVSGGAFTQDSATFILVGLRNDEFDSQIAPSKKTADVTADKICYNDFTFKIKSDGETIVGDATSGAWMTVDFIGREKADTEGNHAETPDGTANAANAARIAVTFDGTTTIYSTDGEDYNAVTTNFVSGITDTDQNRIINGGDSGSGNAGLQAPTLYKALVNADKSLVKLYFGNINATPKEVTVRIWLEGNDKDCVDFADRSIAGKNLLTKINFGIDE